MSQLQIPLESIHVASPCKADWDQMEGEDRARLCLTCQKNVYNLSEMSRGEAETLIREKEGKLCVRFYQRADGTIMTNNCPVGLRVVQRPFKWLAAGAALLLTSGIALATGHDPIKRCLPAGTIPIAPNWRSIRPIARVMDWLNPVSTEIMGDIALPPPPPGGPAPRRKPLPTPTALPDNEVTAKTSA